MLYVLHAQSDAISTIIDLNHLYTDVLVQPDDTCGIGNKFIGKLGNMDESVLMNTDVHKGTKIGDVGDNTRQFHAFFKVVDAMHVLVEFKCFCLSARVASWFFYFLQNVGQGGQACVFGDVIMRFYSLLLLSAKHPTFFMN